MPITVFWAWQSDHDANVGRHFVRKAIEQAISEIANEANFEERPEIDHDTKGVPGLAAIADSIFDKISRASVFIGDLTPIACRVAPKKKRKWVANPNVLLELGYAKNALGTDSLILVWNTAYPGTTPESLPFDLAHRRAPICYHAPAGALKSDLEKAKLKLVAELREAISLALAAALPQDIEKLEWSRTGVNSRSLWFDRANLIAVVNGGESEDWRVDNQPRSWMRIKPKKWPEDVRASDLPSSITLGKITSLSVGRITGASLTWSGSHQEKRARTGTAWFPDDGELWGYDSSALNGTDTSRVIDAPGLLDRWLIFLRYGQNQIVKGGGTGPFLVQCGIGPLTNVRWQSSQRGAGPLAVEEYVSREFVTVDQSQTIQEMWQFYRSLNDAFGLKAESFEGFQALALGRLAN